MHFEHAVSAGSIPSFVCQRSLSCLLFTLPFSSKMPVPKLTILERSQIKESQSLQRGLARSKPEAITSARKFLFFCKAVDLTEEPLYKGPALQRALWRYEALWLPLLVATSLPHASRRVKHSPAFARRVDELRTKNYAKGGLHLDRTELVPPLDIAWVWYCHRLDPHMYAEDIEALTDGGGPIDTTWENAFVFSDGEDAQSKRLRLLWENVYPFEPFMPKYLLSYSYEEDERIMRQKIPTYANAKARAGFPTVIDTRHLMRVSEIQRTFLYQLTGSDGLPQEADTPPGAVKESASTTRFAGVESEADPISESLIETNEYLGRAYDRYLLFLALHKHAPEESLLVPMVDINIMWHAHISCSFEYRMDCQVILGYLLKHDPVSVEDRRNRRTQALLDASAVASAVSEEHNPTRRSSGLTRASSSARFNRQNTAPHAAVQSVTNDPSTLATHNRDSQVDDNSPSVVFEDGAAPGLPNSRPSQDANDPSRRSFQIVNDQSRASSEQGTESGGESRNGRQLTGRSSHSQRHMPDRSDFEDPDDVASLGLPSVELAEMTEDEIRHLIDKRRRGINVKETRKLWEATYGPKPRYDLPDTLYRGEPEGERGGFYDLFVAVNGTSRDIPWYYAFGLMVLAAVISTSGLLLSAWSFFYAMFLHGIYLIGIPCGFVLGAFGIAIFLAIPINRPLSSDARYWRDRDLKHAHNPLPPYLISSTKMD